MYERLPAASLLSGHLSRPQCQALCARARPPSNPIFSPSCRAFLPQQTPHCHPGLHASSLLLPCVNEQLAVHLRQRGSLLLTRTPLSHSERHRRSFVVITLYVLVVLCVCRSGFRGDSHGLLCIKRVSVGLGVSLICDYVSKM